MKEVLPLSGTFVVQKPFNRQVKARPLPDAVRDERGQKQHPRQRGKREQDRNDDQQLEHRAARGAMG